MRLKHKPWAQDKIAEHPGLITTDGTQFKGRWQARFANENPIHLEIGTGKGQFIVALAKKYPEKNFIGLELQSSAIIYALEKQLEDTLPNLQLLNGNAKELAAYFSAGEIAQILLTFSDPWPKTKHAKRRLTHKRFLTLYEEILAEPGELFFKTDNQALFEFSLTSVSQYGMTLNEVFLDLHQSECAEENVMTEFEEKFSKQGSRIYQLRATFK